MLINGALVNIITDSADKDGLLRSRTLFHCVGVYEIQIAQLPSAAAENVILFTATMPQYTVTINGIFLPCSSFYPTFPSTILLYLWT
jgi:hypothetical protein